MRIKVFILSALVLCALRAAGVESTLDFYESRIEAIAGMSDSNKRALAIARFINDTGNDEDTAATASQALENCLLDAGSDIRNEDLYILFVEEMLRSGYPNRVRNEWMLKLVSSNRPGQILPEFEYIDRKGELHSSTELRGCTAMLMFYDPDCSDCSEAISRLCSDAGVRAAVAHGRLLMVCIYADGDKDLWLSVPDKVPAGWIDGIDTGRIAEEDLFVLSESPTIYIIGPDGRILLKEAEVDDVLNLEY